MTIDNILDLLSSVTLTWWVMYLFGFLLILLLRHYLIAKTVKTRPSAPAIQPQESQNKGGRVRVYSLVYFIIVSIYICLYTVVPYYAWGLRATTVEFAGEVWNVGFGMLMLQVTHLAFSIRMVKTTKLGGLTLFGLPVLKVYAGPAFAPREILKLGTETRQVIQRQFPDEPENVFKGTDDAYDALPPEQKRSGERDEKGQLTGKLVRPIRMTTGGPKPSSIKEALEKGQISPLETQMVIEVSYFARFQIVDYFTFLVHFKGSVDEIVRQIRDTSEKLLAVEIGSLTPAKVIAGLLILNEKLMSDIRNVIEPWGVALKEAGMVSPDINHEVAQQLRNTAKAKAEANQIMISAEANRILIEKTGLGEGAAERARLAGRGQGLKEMAEALNVKPHQVLAAETARETFKNVEQTVVLGTEGVAQIIGVAKAVQAALAKTTSAPSKA